MLSACAQEGWDMCYAFCCLGLRFLRTAEGDREKGSEEENAG